MEKLCQNNFAHIEFSIAKLRNITTCGYIPESVSNLLSHVQISLFWNVTTMLVLKMAKYDVNIDTVAPSELLQACCVLKRMCPPILKRLVWQVIKCLIKLDFIESLDLDDYYYPYILELVSKDENLEDLWLILRQRPRLFVNSLKK